MLAAEISKTSVLMLSRSATQQLSRFSTTVRRYKQDDQLKVFRDNATKWWNGKEFSVLRSMNKIRVPFIVDGLGKPISDSKIIDVGCGGGLLSEPLARLGAQVTGIDPVFESINQAQLHSQTDEDLKDRLKYRNCNIEDISSQPEHIDSYDALVASEVLEHIEDVEGFLKHCTKVIKTNGSLFITTINQTPLSWLGVIFMGEYVFQQLPKGTHTYDMFVSVKGLRVMLERLGYHVRSVNGFMYEPVSGNFYWTPTTLTHYAVHAIKTIPSAKGLNHEQRRYSKVKKIAKPKMVLDDIDMALVVPIDQWRERVDKIMSELQEHLERKLTTRVNIASLESLKIDHEGISESLELRDIAQISMKNPSLITINLSTMPDAVKSVMKALETLGNVTPQAEVNNIYVQIPKVSREHREKLASSAKQACSQAKDKLKKLFSEYSSIARKPKTGVSVDIVRGAIDNLQYDVNQKVSKIDDMLNAKVDALLNQKN